MKTYISKYKIKADIDNIKIVHISDIHYHHTFNKKRFNILLNDINKLNPNYICITGDIIDNREVLDDETDYQIFKNFIINLGIIAKTIITLGNHEMKGIRNNDYSSVNYKNIINKLRKIDNVIILDNEIYSANDINFIGYNPTNIYYDNSKRDSNVLIEDFNKQNFKLNSNYNVLLIHTPKDLLKKNIYDKINCLKDIDLILSGHTHGGMVPNGIKGNFGLISPEKSLFPAKVRGHLIRNRTHLIISSGIIRLSHSSHLHCLTNFYKMSINEITISR